MRVGEAQVSRGRAEEKNVLLGRTNQVAHSFRKQFAEPRTASENIVISFEPRAIGKRQAAKRRILHTVGRDRELPIRAASSHERIDHGLTTGASVEISALRFVDSPPHIRKIDLRPAFLHLCSGEFLKLRFRLREALSRESRSKLSSRLLTIQRTPVRCRNCRFQRRSYFDHSSESSRGEPRIGLIGTISPAHDASLASRRGARISRTPSVEQSDASSALQKMKRGPASEGAGSDHGDMWDGLHSECFRIKRT